MHNILIIDDEKRMRDSLKVLLSGEGYEVETADNCQGGIECLKKGPYALVVTDLVTPRLTGFEVMDHVAKHCPETLVIAMTGYASLDSAVEAMRRGAYDYIVKPFNFDVMKLTVERAIDRVNLSRRVRKTEEKYKLLVEEINDGYFVLQDKKLVYANKTFAGMLGYKPEDITGRDFTYFIGLGTYPKFEQLLLTENGDSVQEEFHFKSKEGVDVPVEIRVTRTYTDDQPSLVGICRDIRERKALWDKIIRSEKLASLGGLIAGIAHELNNKLTPVLAYAELMGDSTLDPQNRRRIDIIANSAMGAKKVVESLLLFARQEKPQRKRIDINEVIHNALNLLQYQFKNEKIALRLDLNPDLPDIFADFHQMEQVFLNIIKNAFQAMDGTGGQLTIFSLSDEKDIIVEISDTGVGISPEILPIIFDPFFTTKAEGKGTGLGLSLCHGIVQEHGGEISVTSEPGRTTFQVKLPLNRPEVNHGQYRYSSDDSTEKGVRKTILVIDDEESISLLLSELLEGKYEVARVSNGHEALKVMANKEFDLIISDIKMPGMDGMEFFKWIEANKPLYKRKIVFTTGITFDAEVHAFLESTKNSYLTKPFKIAQLMEAVETTLMKSEGQ
ncbi:MAG: response regulator [Thermodesulfobacteriota bacterium]|nr:response regulator [Thermodesulfobacteriota bacterium]